MVYRLGKNPCPNKKCGSSDAFHWYGDEKGGYCWSCGWTIKSKSDIEEEIEWDVAEFTDEQHKALKENTTFNPKGFRGLREDTCKLFGVRHEYDVSTGQLKAQYYPVTTEGVFTGYKKRAVPKKFSALNVPDTEGVGYGNDLFGQFRFEKSKAKYCVIVGGEVDQLSAFQMLRDYQVRSGKADYAPIAVVSPTVGESGCLKQIQNNYEFFTRFEKVIIAFDSDETGQAAAEKIVKALPQGKVFVMEMELKDPNEYLEQKREREFISAFFDAKPYTPKGVVGSSTLYDKTIEQARTPKIPLPTFMKKLQDMMAGGIPLGYIVNLGAASGIGKTSFVNELIYYWIFHCPHLIGVVSLELNEGQYGEVLLSRHLGRKLALIADPETKVDFLQQEDTRAKADELFKTEDGYDRFHLIGERDGTLKSMQSTIEELVIACGCKVIIIDPLQDLLDGLSNEEQALFMKWQKGMVNTHGITFINVNHTRKQAAGSDSGSEGAFITEEDFAGSSTIFKSAGVNLLFMRNKYAEDEMERNTTKCMCSKNRWTGLTGIAGEYYYDNQSHTLHDKEQWLKDHPVDF